MEVMLPVPSGVISAVYFVLLELLLERLVFALTAFTSRAGAVQDVVNGEAKLITESKVPLLGEGLTTASYRNYYVYAARLALLAVVLMTNLATDGAVGPVYKQRRADYIGRQRATNEEWLRPGYHSFERNERAVAACRRPAPDGYDFYQSTVNLENGRSDLVDFLPDPTNETEKHLLKQDEIYCLDGVQYAPRRPALSLVHCGTGASACLARTQQGNYTQEVTVTRFAADSVPIYFREGREQFGLVNNDFQWECVALASYLHVRCLRWHSGANGTLIRSELITHRFDYGADGNQETILFQHSQPEATVAGGSFESVAVAQALRGVYPTDGLDIVQLVSNIYAQSVEYEQLEDDVFQVVQVRSITQIHLAGIIGLAASFAIFVVVGLVAVWAGNRFRHAPVTPWKFTLDGISSVLHDTSRSVAASDSGKSRETGHVALCEGPGGHVRLAPHPGQNSYR